MKGSSIADQHCGSRDFTRPDATALRILQSEHQLSIMTVKVYIPIAGPTGDRYQQTGTLATPELSFLRE